MAQGLQAGLLANLAAAPVKLEGHGRALDRDSRLCLGALSALQQISATFSTPRAPSAAIVWPWLSRGRASHSD